MPTPKYNLWIEDSGTFRPAGSGYTLNQLSHFVHKVTQTKHFNFIPEMLKRWFNNQRKEHFFFKDKDTNVRMCFGVPKYNPNQEAKHVKPRR